MAAGSAVAMIGANLRFGGLGSGNASLNATRMFQCHPGGAPQAALVVSLGALGMGANAALMAIILLRRQLRRWSQGLLFHQAMVDCARAAILLPLGMSIFKCQPVHKCSLVETAFLLLVTVSTVNMLTTVLNDSPVFPEDDDEADLTGPLLMDSPQCVLFGTFMIWFASITINLGPTFLSGALAANTEAMHNAPSCPLVHGPFRHYVLNVLWIAINLICVMLTLFHLRKLHRDLTKANCEAVRVTGLVTTLVSVTGEANQGVGNGTHRSPGATEQHRRVCNYLVRVEKEGVQRVRMFVLIAVAYILLWGPLFFVTLVHHPSLASPLGYEITLHISYAHAIVNPTLFLILHRGLRRGVAELACGLVHCGRTGGPRPHVVRGVGSPRGAPAYEVCLDGPPAPVPPPPLHKAPLSHMNNLHGNAMRDPDPLMIDPWGLPPLPPPAVGMRNNPMTAPNSPLQDDSE